MIYLDPARLRRDTSPGTAPWTTWLRRRKRRIEAREQLRAAYTQFEQMGAAGFAERARLELVATGETARKPSPETRNDLMP